MCQGKCKGDRLANESPAVFATVAGRKVIFCPCCSLELTPTNPDFNTGAPNIKAGVERREKRFIDTVCNYDVVVLKDLKI